MAQASLSTQPLVSPNSSDEPAVATPTAVAPLADATPEHVLMGKMTHLWEFPSIMQLWIEMRQQTASIIANAVFADVLSQLVHMKNEQLKRESYSGFVFCKRQLFDQGNWTYSLLWFMLRREGSRGDSGDVVGHLDQVVENHPSLVNSSPGGLELQGDVIEVLLSVARETGHAVDRRTAELRHHLHRCIRTFGDTCDSLLYKLSPEYIKITLRPWPHDFMRVFYVSQGISRCNERNTSSTSPKLEFHNHLSACLSALRARSPHLKISP